MLKYIFAFIVLVHGLIHLMGFAKGFGYGAFTQLTKDISKQSALLWLLAALLFVSTTILFLLKKESWPYFGITAVLISQILIIGSWKDARYGSIANLIVLLAAIAALGGQYFESRFRKDVKSMLLSAKAVNQELVQEADLLSLPEPVQQYLRYSGAIGQPKLKNMRIVFEGEMRSKTRDWFPFTVLQYNFFDQPARLFFMKARMFGIEVPGYHHYQNAAATMDIRLFGLFSVVREEGPVLTKGETVIVFNDMCLMAPASLIDKRIEWTAIDRLTARASFTNGAYQISATLSFNEKGQLINFFSDDRMDITEMKQYRFSTPLKEYGSTRGIQVMKYGEAVWHYPDGEFVYGKFYLKSIDHNVSD